MTFKLVADRVLSVFFPKRCRYCGEVIVPQNSLCESCENNLPVIEKPICPLCGYSKNDCFCKSKKHYYDSVVAPFYYENAITKAIDRMKFQGKSFMCDVLAADMAKTVSEEYGDIVFDYICFIPFSNSEKREREFNHSQLIAEKISELTDIECIDAISQIYEVPSQHSLGSNERKGNVFGIYEINEPQKVNDKNILLVDDIKTTGSTLDECAKMLKLAGAQTVRCVTFAVTKKKKK